MIRPTITAEEFALLLGVATWTLYQSVRDGTCPVQPIRVGRRMVWSSAVVAALLGVDSLDGWMWPTQQSDGVDPGDSVNGAVTGTVGSAAAFAKDLDQQFERSIGD